MKIIPMACMVMVICSCFLFAQEPDYFVMVYNKTDLSASIDINGYVVASGGVDASSSGQMELNLWLMKGDNKITIKFLKALGAVDSTNRKLSVKIYKAQAGQFPTDGTQLLSFEVSSSSGDSIVFPSEKVLSLSVPEAPPLVLWNKAEPLTLLEADRLAITALLIRLNTVLDIGYGSELIRLLAFRSDEGERAHYLDPGANATKIAAQMVGIFPYTQHKMEAVPLGLDFHSIADGRVIWVTDAQGRNPLRVKPQEEGPTIEIAVYVAKIDGVWTLVR